MVSASHIVTPTTLLALSVLSSGLLGGVVLLKNPARRTHQVFALMSFNLALWSLGVLLIIQSHTDDWARFWIMGTFMVACFLPATFYQFVVLFPFQRFEGQRTVLTFLYGGAALVALGVFSPWYIEALEVFPNRPPLVTYGPAFRTYLILVVVSMLFSTGNLARKLRHTTGVQRRQVEHVLLSLGATAVFGSFTNVIAPVMQVGTLEIYGPCFVLLMVAGLAYSMVRYHLLDIWVIVSRTTVYAVVTAFVIATFLGTVSAVHWVFSGGGRMNDITTTALAALVVVLILQPLKERVQLLLDRIVLHRRYDSRAFLSRVSRVVAQSVRLDELLKGVAGDIRNTLGVRLVRVYLVDDRESGTLLTEYSTQEEEVGARNIKLDTLLSHIEQHPEPISLEELLHGRPTPEKVHLAEHLRELDTFLLVPLKTTSGVVGILGLGEKESRDMYVWEDVKVFSTLAGPLATSIENARLYRKLEELNLQLERILTNMRGGVVAVDSEGVLTNVNQEARELCGTVAAGVRLDALPDEVSELLRETLKEGRGIGDVETAMRGPDGEIIPVAMSSSLFGTADGESSGAMVLIYNMTQIKRLESNVQRADRLSSIGVMAAGMAHEIKNPLQSIKTFTQLLPQRFEDEDFRKTFREVIPPEVRRIDMIVTRLLDFARPRPVSFGPRDLRRVIEDVVALVDNQTRKVNARVDLSFPEEERFVTGDDQQLHQVFLNLVLNAIAALEDCGECCISLGLSYGRARLASKNRRRFLDVPCAKVTVTDTGCGIPLENVDHLFTPFFTTKDNGFGLGLSVVHGIVTEHGGQVDVSSVPGAGTTFTVTLPLAEESEAAERVGV